MSRLSGRRLLAPAAYSEAMMPSLQLARSSRMVRIIAKILFVLLAITFGLVAFAPWQQSVKGSGSVVAYAPDERQQVVESQIKGRIAEFGPGIVENARVVEGQFILRIQDIDPDLLLRLEQQRRVLNDSLQNAKRKLEAYRGLVATNEDFGPIDAQLESYKQVKDRVEAEANANIEAARNKVAAMEQAQLEADAVLFEAKAEFDRQDYLFKKDIVSKQKFQAAQRKHKAAITKLASAKEYVAQAENDLKAKTEGRDAYVQKAQVDIDKARAMKLKQQTELQKAQANVQQTLKEINDVNNKLIDMDSKIAKQKLGQRVEAPMDGIITQITPNSGTQSLKPGDPLCVIVPDTADRAVQIWLDGNDAPLVDPGRHVRLQFEGWPAVQFAGWPSVAVGTFGGEVISVDATDNGKGKFRVLIKPDKTDVSWPGQQYLRQGVRANGWVLLKRVPLWFEIWRQMNGFPPVVSPDGPDKSEKGDKKKPKLPKP